MFRVYNPYFYNNCQIYWALISSCLSSIRVQTDKILFYASFQQFNVNQWDFIDFLKKPIKKRENAIDNVRVILNEIHLAPAILRRLFPSFIPGI